MGNWRGMESYAELKLERFEGLDTTAAPDKQSKLADLYNLRRCADGSLIRREGYRPIAALGAYIRGAVACKFGESEVIFAVAGETIYALTAGESTNFEVNALGTIGTKAGNVEFFEFDGGLLLMDGKEMYSLTSTAVIPVRPYIPLYGKDWTADDYGTIYEERNQLTDQVHIRYVMMMQASGLNLRVTAEAVDRVYLNGVEVTDNYTYSVSSQQLDFSSILSIGTVVDVIMTLPSEERTVRAGFFSCCSAILPTEAGKTSVLFSCGKDGEVLYLTRDISQEMRACCRAVEPNACMLYLGEEGRMELCDNLHPVTAMVRHYDRTLLFTDTGAMASDGALTNEGKLVFRSINSSRGCSVRAGALLIGNSPMSICGQNILCWTADTDELNECNARVISSPIAAMLPEGFGQRARVFENRASEEVWFYLPGEEARVFVWQEAMQIFTTLEGILPTRVFAYGNGVGFARGETLFLLDATSMCDTDEEGNVQPISCGFSTNDLNFGHAGCNVRSGTVTLCAICEEGQAVSATLVTAGGRQATAEMKATGEFPCEMTRRMRVGRFRHAHLTVRCECIGKFQMVALMVTALR